MTTAGVRIQNTAPRGENQRGRLRWLTASGVMGESTTRIQIHGRRVSESYAVRESKLKPRPAFGSERVRVPSLSLFRTTSHRAQNTSPRTIQKLGYADSGTSMKFPVRRPPIILQSRPEHQHGEGGGDDDCRSQNPEDRAARREPAGTLAGGEVRRHRGASVDEGRPTPHSCHPSLALRRLSSVLPPLAPSSPPALTTRPLATRSAGVGTPPATPSLMSPVSAVPRTRKLVRTLAVSDALACLGEKSAGKA